MDESKRLEIINKAIDRLSALYDCNHEVMDADDIGDLLTTIHNLKTMRNELSSSTTKIREVYAEADDMTFIMEEEFVGEDVKSIECIGWYCGEPNEEDTIHYARHGMIAIY